MLTILLARHHRLIGRVALSFFLGCVCRLNAESRAGEFLAGDALERQLDQNTSVTWERIPIREGLANLSQAHRAATFLDRRVDPSTPADVSVRNQPLREAFREIAESAGLFASQVGPVIYIGPPQTAGKLRTLAAIEQERLAHAPSKLRAMMRKAPLAWDELSSPREILERLQKDCPAPIEGLDQIPHDLWPRVAFPAMTLGERFALVLAGFDARITWDESRKSLVCERIPETVRMERQYPAGTKAAERASAWSNEWPNAVVQQRLDAISVRATWEEHAEIAARLRGNSALRQPRKGARRSRGVPRKEYRLTAHLEDQPLEATLQVLCDKLELKLEIDRASLGEAGISLDQPVSCHVDNADAKELFGELLTGTGADYQIDAGVLRVGARRP